MGKSPWDLAAILSVIAKPERPIDYLAAVIDGKQANVTDFRIGVYHDAEPHTYDIDPDNIPLIRECHEYYERVIEKLQPVINPIECEAISEILGTAWEVHRDKTGDLIGHADLMGTTGDFSKDFEKYMRDHVSPVKTLEEVIEWMEKHPVSFRSLLTELAN